MPEVTSTGRPLVKLARHPSSPTGPHTLKGVGPRSGRCCNGCFNGTVFSYSVPSKRCNFINELPSAEDHEPDAATQTTLFGNCERSSGNPSEDQFMIIQRCTHPRCFNARPCEKHPQPAYRDTKTAEERRFYASRRWTELSLRHRRLEPLCRECKRRGITRAGQMTDHIIRIRAGGDCWDESNLQTLCHPCHNAKRQHERTVRT
jgi:5-methylcytosine-specific restriction enzyme A